MKFKVVNDAVRNAIQRTGHFQWEVAKKLGYGESVFSRKLREELPLDEQAELVERITRIRWERRR